MGGANEKDKQLNRETEREGEEKRGRKIERAGGGLRWSSALRGDHVGDVGEGEREGGCEEAAETMAHGVEPEVVREGHAADRSGGADDRHQQTGLSS